jgi:hypothetical protein
MTQAPGRWSKLGPVVSGLCFVHCVGTAALAPVLPGAVALLTGATWLEPCLWLVSLAATGASLRRAGVDLRVKMAWLLAAAMGVLGFALDADRLVQVSLGSSVALQLMLVVRRWKSARAACADEDCDACESERNFG